MTGQTSAGDLDFDLCRLDAYLRDWLGGSAATRVTRTSGGMSNPTYFVTRGDWRAVLRKQPNNVLMPSAHAIDREYRVLTALQENAAPTPKPYRYCEDRDVLGTPFYLMEWLEGRVVHDYALPGFTRDERFACYRSMCAALAAIHKLDFRAVGLADFGKPGNYFARQLSRWSKLWIEYRRDDDDNPALDRMVRWLSERVPESEGLALCHGDFRMGNLVFHPTEPHVVGVLDWELSTLGHPLVDLAFNSQAWRMAPDENGGLLGLPLDDMGIPSERDYLELYYQLSGATERLTVFHQVFAMFRGAVGSAGVAARGDLGNNVLPDAANVGRRLARAYATRGMALIESES
ncbi:MULTISPECIES: phosphotransferase family protein [unclassified Bradyrhizobium]|uniref:phosphotransferase family protein n=1 Tax=unclassified Bradyrhizobium TaxID=2631580 RepID=UPI002478EE53|nr:MULTISPECIES: phosphotransferase family protein [unclassified Bradyrhizobium]WGS17780.1 phosphotransferase family protein [Bradyrhizobium sp. ISRA463]WGS24576.1 phosphotransferase family protein [Bradyrhizobium sp. ISRA464]